MSEHPTGTVTFLFTDVEGSVKLWEEDRERAGRLIDEHNRIIGDAILANGGVVLSTAGDSFDAAFHTPTDAVAAAVESQLALAGSLPVRMAIHMGPVESRPDGQYTGPALYRCGRLRDAAHGGQVICSHAVADVVIDHLDELDLIDLGEHRLKDLGRPERIHQIAHPDLPAAFPPLKTLSADRTNLPIQVTSFVGRDQEMAWIDKLLHASRLVTLTGSGGCGKSRLAVETAARLADDHPDGIWLVELASIDRPDLVASTVASVLGVRESPDTGITEAIVAHLEQRTMLVILDNCEHLLDPVATLTDVVLTSTSDVRILATSREPLHAHGEAIYPVPALPLPGDEADFFEISHTDAVRLFVERASAASPDFHLTTDTAPAVASICRHLDGIPLAVELAAATSRLLSLPELEARLDDRFRLLRGGSRDPLPHHRTLQAALDWSYRHLTSGQQMLFGRLAVFEGGWRLEAAEAVCPGDPIERGDVLPLLADLVDRSLVTRIESPQGTRYDLLETVHAYAADLGLVTEGLQARHADWCRDFAEEVRPWLTANRTEEGLTAFRAELPNIRAALEYFEDADNAFGYCSLLAALRRFLHINRDYVEADGYYRHALDIMSDDLPPGLRGEILMGAGWNTSRGHGRDDERAKSLIHRAAELLDVAGDHRHLSEAHSYLTTLEDDPEYAERALAAAERSGEPTAMARPHHYLGITKTLAGEYGEALPHFRQAIDGFQAANLKAYATTWAAIVLLRMDETDDALQLAIAALATFETIHDLGGIETALHAIGEVELLTRSPEEALATIRRRVDVVQAAFGQDSGVLAIAAFAAARAGNCTESLHHLRALLSAPGADLLLDDSLDHAFLAVALLALGTDTPSDAAAVLGAEANYRSTHRVLPNIPRERLIGEMVDDVRGRLDPAGFDDAWQRGTEWTLDDIVDLALDRYDAPSVVDDRG